MSGSDSQAKISLKILVDVKSNKVVFAEADKEFVDFIFGIMSLPLSTVTKLLNEKAAAGMVGCLGVIYKSIESLGAQYYKANLNRDSVLKPKSSVIVPLLSLVDAPAAIRFYRCQRCRNYYSDCKGMMCSFCDKTITEELTYNLVTPELEYYSNPGIVKEAVSYMVMDNLDVKPMSISLIRSLVNDFDILEEKQVEFGHEEGIALLKASLEKQEVLTSVFLESRVITMLRASSD